MLHSPTLVRPLRIDRAWPLRVASDFVERLAALGSRARAGWLRLRERRRERRELLAAGDLSEALLRDMGAPDWLQAQANAQREARRFERELLRLEPRREGRDGRFGL